MSEPFNYDLDATTFADWLSRGEAGERLWTVDGEETLIGQLQFPCSGADLASVLREHGGRLRVFAPEGRTIPSGEPSADQLEEFAEVEDGARLFVVAWLDNEKPGEHWIIAEDTFAEEAKRSADAHS